MSGSPTVMEVARDTVGLEGIAALCAVALPDEPLTLDDLEALLGDDDPSDGSLVRRVATGVWGVTDDAALVGVAIGSVTEVVGMRSAHLQLLAVHPARRRRGLARALVGEFERWAAGAGASELVVGAGAPFYVFTGVDTRWLEALCCFEAMGYHRSGTELDLVCSTTPTATSRNVALPDSTTVDRVVDDRDVEELLVWVRRHFPHWEAEFARAGHQGTVVLVRDDEGSVVGAAAHSVSRTGVIGPVAVAPDRQRSGVGVQLMQAVLAELSTAGMRSVEIAWTSTVRFYARACGARVGRASVVLRRTPGA